MDEQILEQNAVTVHIPSLSFDNFMRPGMLDRFTAAISTLQDEWLPEDVRVFSIQPLEHDGGRTEKRVEVGFFVTALNYESTSYDFERLNDPSSGYQRSVALMLGGALMHRCSSACSSSLEWVRRALTRFAQVFTLCPLSAYLPLF